MRESFVLYTEYEDTLELLSTEECGLLFKAIFAYQSGRELPDLPVGAKVAFSFIKKRMDADAEKYEETCRKRAEAGRKGAAVTNAQKESADAESDETEKRQNRQMPNLPKTEAAKSADNDIDLDIDNDIDKKEKQNKKKAAASAYVDDPELNAAICSFVESRKKLRKPMTDRAIELFISRVQKTGGSLSEQIDLINTAVERGWQTVYPKSDKAGGWTVRAPATTKFSNFEQRENDLDELALEMAKKRMEVLSP